MKAILVALTAAAILSGCQTTPRVIQNTQLVLIEPPAALLNCPAAGPVPKFDTLTNKQVVAYIDKLYKARNVCAINIKQIKDFIAKSKVNLK